MKIGVFGGLFDPPHIGHLIIAQHVIEEFGLQQILFIPSGSPPHKTKYSPYEHRHDMAALAIAGNECFALSDIERRASGTTYTIETVRALSKESPDEMYLMIGADQLFEIENWKDPDLLFRECRVVVMKRPHHEIQKDQKFLDRIMISTAPMIDISSTMVRSRVEKGLSVRYFVTEEVRAYIERNNLYRTKLPSNIEPDRTG